MSKIVLLFFALYRFLIRLYPRPFREEFGGEMEAVFQEQMAEAEAHSRIILLQACWRELRDWPRLCIQAHWHARQQQLKLSTGEQLSWWDTALPGIPFFILAIFLSGSTLFFLFGQGSGFLITLVFGYGFLFLFLLVLIFAWWRGWPSWSASWLGFLFFILLVIFLPVQLFYVARGPQMWSVGTIFIDVGLPLLWLAVLYVLLYRWPRAGLVAMLPTFGMAWFLYLEFVPEIVSTAVMAAAWIWLGIVAIVLLRWRHHAWDVWILYLAALVVGSIFIFAGHFLTEIQVRSGTFARMGHDLISNLLPAVIPLVGILLLHTLRLWSRANGRMAAANGRMAAANGRMAAASYRLILAGVLLTFIGVQTNLQLLRQGNLLALVQNMGFWFTASLLIGFLLVLAGTGLIVKSRRQWQLPIGWPIWLLLSLLFLMLFVLDIRWLSVIYHQIRYLQLGQEQFAQQQIEIRELALRPMSPLVGVVWLLLSGWVIGRVRLKLPPVQSKKAEETDPATAVQRMGSPIPKPSGAIRKRDIFYLVTGLLILAGSLLPLTTLASFFPNDQVQTFDLSTAFPLFLLFSIALIIAAPTLSSGLRLYLLGARRTAVLFLVLSAFLLAKAMHNFYWLFVWDSTTDALGFLWLFIPISGVFFAAIWLAFTLPNRAKLAAFLYLLSIPPLLMVIFGSAQRSDFRRLTEARAGRASQALEAYYDQEGHYPEDLGQLTPGYLFAISEPVIIFGQDWCYDGGGDDYHFGYVYREHWSDPRLVGLRYSATNTDATDLPPICDEEILILEARDPQYYGLRKD